LPWMVRVVVVTALGAAVGVATAVTVLVAQRP
jgi:hypothetical protein